MQEPGHRKNLRSLPGKKAISKIILLSFSIIIILLSRFFLPSPFFISIDRVLGHCQRSRMRILRMRSPRFPGFFMRRRHGAMSMSTRSRWTAMRRLFTRLLRILRKRMPTLVFGNIYEKINFFKSSKTFYFFFFFFHFLYL